MLRARALDVWLAAQLEPSPDRATAILVALRDLLTGLGHLSFGEEPGPPWSRHGGTNTTILVFAAREGLSTLKGRER